MIEFKNVTFSYDKKKNVIKDVTFTLNDGECAILLGPNGVGKTTILRCILGELKPTSGTVLINNKDNKGLKNKDLSKAISFVPQNINGTDLTVSETILLGRLPSFDLFPKREDYIALNDVLNEFSLNEIKDKNTFEISGGEKQKVAIARAYIQNTSTIIFDEPTSNLDIKAQVMIASLIKKITKENKRSTLISMHDINLALSLADKLILLKDEQIYKITTPKEITSEDLETIYGIKTTIKEIDGRKVVIYE